MGKLIFIGLVMLEVALIPIKIPLMVLHMIFAVGQSIYFKITDDMPFREYWALFKFGFTSTLYGMIQWYGILWRTGEFE